MWLKQSTSVTIKFGPGLDFADGVTPETGLATAMDSATTGIRISKNGGNMIDRVDSTVPAHDEVGYYDIVLGATDTNTLGTLKIMFNGDTVNLPLWQDFMVVPANVYDSMFGSDKLQTDVEQILGTAITETGAGDVASAFIKLFDVTTPLLVASEGMRGTDSAALASVLGALADAASAGDPTSAETVIQYLKQLVNTLEGSVGIPVLLASQDPANDISIVEMIGKIFDNLVIADTAIDGVKSETALIVEDTGTTIPGTITTLQSAIDALNNISAADLQTALGTNGSNVIPELVQGIPDITPSLADAIMLLYMHLRNISTSSSSSIAIANNAGTVIAKATSVTDDGTTFTKPKLETGP